MQAEVTVEYTEAMIRRAVRRFWTRFLGWDYLAALFVGLAAFVALLLLGYAGWYTVVLGTVVALAVIVGASAYFVYLKRSMGILKQMESPQAVFRFDEDGVSTQSDLGSSTMRWRAVTKIWRFPEVWLLFFSKRVYVTLPSEGLSPELLQFIAAKVRENGGKVK
ncbi:MAG: YcxB family protein [Planctomycetota bacterium]